MSFFGAYDPWADLRDMQRQMDRLVGFYSVDDGYRAGSDSVHPKSAEPSNAVTTQQHQQQQGAGHDASQEVGAAAANPFVLSQWAPRMDVRESDKGLIVHTELPGCTKDDIKLSVDNNRLVLEGHKRTHKSESGDTWVRRERFEGRFYRSLPLPRGVDASQIEAQYKDGVLEVVIPKPADTPKKQTIDIKV